MDDPDPPPTPPIDLSVVVPARNERPCLEPLAAEIDAALDAIGVPAEVIVVDDASTDGSDAVLADLARRSPRYRPLRLPPREDGRGWGQGAALGAGIGAARGAFIAMLDGDGQNDPADLVPMWRALRERGADLVQGDRTGHRADGAVRTIASGIGRLARRLLLGDRVRDTGCTLRIMRRSAARALPLEYDGMHRFIPHLARCAGAVVVEMQVAHRPRRHGRSRYAAAGRAWPGLIDALAVRWMGARRRRVEARPIAPRCEAVPAAAGRP